MGPRGKFPLHWVGRAKGAHVEDVCRSRCSWTATAAAREHNSRRSLPLKPSVCSAIFASGRRPSSPALFCDSMHLAWIET